jgi:hypothetical protein
LDSLSSARNQAASCPDPSPQKTATRYLQPAAAAELSRADGAVWTWCLQAQRLEELQESLAVPYDGDNLQHQQQLQELWTLAFPSLPFPVSIKSNQWKEMGWQVGATATQRVQLLETLGPMSLAGRRLLCISTQLGAVHVLAEQYAASCSVHALLKEVLETPCGEQV